MRRKKGNNADYGRLDMYKFFIRSNPDLKDTSYRQYSDVMNACNKGLSKLILENAYEYIITGLGNLRIKKYKPRIKFDKDGKLITNSLTSIEINL